MSSGPSTPTMASDAIAPTTFENLHPFRYLTFSFPNPSTSTTLRIAVLDSPLPSPHPPTTAAMLVPAGRESDWIFSTAAGHLQLLLSSHPLSRLILAGHDPPSLTPTPYSPLSDPDPDPDLIQQHLLLPLLLALAPRAAFAAGIPHIPFLLFDDDVVRSSPVEILTGPVAGEMLVEDVELASGSDRRRRRLRFKRMPNLVQTQVRLLPDSTRSIPELGSLVQPYLAPMAAGLLLIGPYLDGKRSRPRALCIGVGGGALLMFLELRLGFDVVGVEADDVVLRAAKRHFGLVEGQFLRVCVGDGIEFIEKFAREETDGAGGFDVVMVDLDSADAASNISAPPLEFVQKGVLVAVRSCLCEHGMLVINVIALEESFYKVLVDCLRDVFTEVHELDVGNGENFVLIATTFAVGSVESMDVGPFSSKLKQVIGERYMNQIRRI